MRGYYAAARQTNESSAGRPGVWFPNEEAMDRGDELRSESGRGPGSG